MNEKTLNDLAQHVGGRVVGDGGVRIHSVAGLGQAQQGQISFLANRRYARMLATTKASAVIVAEAVDCPVPQLLVENPHFAYTQTTVLLHGHRKHRETGISPGASIDPTAKIGEQCHIHQFATVCENARIGKRCIICAGAFIGANVEMGDDCVIQPNVVVYDGVRIGHRVIIDANSSIGQDGFGFATHKGAHHKIPHLGRVRLEDEVVIGANCAVQSGALNDTVVGRGTKVGDGAVIGHGAQIGQGCLIVSQVGIAGSTTLGNYCVLAGQVGISGHLKIGDRVTVAAKSGVASNLESGAKVFGIPAFDLKPSLEAHTLLRSLPEMRKALKRMERRLAELEAGANASESRAPI